MMSINGAPIKIHTLPLTNVATDRSLQKEFGLPGTSPQMPCQLEEAYPMTASQPPNQSEGSRAEVAASTETPRTRSSSCSASVGKETNEERAHGFSRWKPKGNGPKGAEYFSFFDHQEAKRKPLPFRWPLF